MVTVEMARLSARTLAKSASAIASCGRLSPSMRTLRNSFLSPKIPPGQPLATTRAILALPTRTFSKRSCGRPPNSQSLAEPILTVRPSASLEMRS